MAKTLAKACIIAKVFTMALRCSPRSRPLPWPHDLYYGQGLCHGPEAPAGNLKYLPWPRPLPWPSGLMLQPWCLHHGCGPCHGSKVLAITKTLAVDLRC